MEKLIVIIIIAAIFVACVLINAKLTNDSGGGKKTFRQSSAGPFIVTGIAAMAIIILFNTVLMLNKIPSGSMETTIMAGDLVVATRYDTTRYRKGAIS